MMLIDTPVNVFDAECVCGHLARLEAHRGEIAWPDESIAFWRRQLAEIESRARGAERPADGPEPSGRSYGHPDERDPD